MAEMSGASRLPSSNRGVSETEQVGVVIDWCAASFDLLAVLDVSLQGFADDRVSFVDDLNGPVGFNALSF